MTGDEEARIQRGIETMLDRRAFESALSHRYVNLYVHLETLARRRVPRDPNDWPTVVLAIALDAGILANDYAFLGCGCPTRTIETLHAELRER